MYSSSVDPWVIVALVIVGVLMLVLVVFLAMVMCTRDDDVEKGSVV